MEIPPADGSECAFDHGHSDSSSVCSSQASRKDSAHSSEMMGKAKPQSKKIYRACVALMPSPPARAGTGQPPESSEGHTTSRSEVEQKLEKTPLVPAVEEIHRSVENDELQQVIREVSSRLASIWSVLSQCFLLNVVKKI